MMSTIKRGFFFCATLTLILSLAARALAAEPEQSGGSMLTLVFYTINFVAFVVLLVKYAATSVRDYFLVRKRTISSAFAQLEEALRKAREQAQEAAARLDQLASEKARLEASLRRQVEHEAESLRQSARGLAAQIRRDSDLAARSLGEAAERQFRSEVARRAAHAAEELLRRNSRPADQHRLVESFIAQMAQLEAR